MFRYRGVQDGLCKIEDTEDGAIDLVNETELRAAMLAVGEIDDLWFDDGNIRDDFGVVRSKAPVITKNRNLHKAKSAKNDEFYTQLADIEKELSQYPPETFKDKVIYCPTDVAVTTGSTMQSQFVKFFQLNANRLQFRKLIATCLVERAAHDGESLEQVQNCYILERKTVPMLQRNIHGYTHGQGTSNPVVGEQEEYGIKYVTQDGNMHPVPYHIVNQAVTDATGRIKLVRKYIDHYDENDGHMVLGDEFKGISWKWGGHQLTIKWCRKHPDGAIEMLPDECYFFNNNDIISDFGVFPLDEDGNPCFESVP